ncbi:unnamed protein product [Prorocentrum cordatum]|uniref:Uncharacterized protein n=1 Tax=Prorocentrum cordatum TaxID=2364126 RepID=A0ABN9WLF0_9DINO|nr:unnamed protein product [Polarella glacialis]
MALRRKLQSACRMPVLFCPMCGGTVDSYGDRAFVCSCSGNRVVRHNRVRDSACEDAARGHMGPKKEAPSVLQERPRDDRAPPSGGGGEAPGLAARSRRRPVDVFFLGALGGAPAAPDFACASGLRADVMRDAAANPDCVLSAYEEAPGETVFLVIESHSGGWGKTARQILDAMARRVSACWRVEAEAEVESLRIA